MLLGKTGQKLAWLAEEIAKRRDRAKKLAKRLEALDFHSGMQPPGVRKKFIKYLHEIANEREDEARLFWQVEAIERHHRDMRLRKRLSYVRRRGFSRSLPSPLRAVAKDIRQEARATRRTRKAEEFLLLLLILWYLLAHEWRPFVSKKKDGLLPPRLPRP